ncbi:hypothetical protein [Citrobacter freundii]|uniref:hypothetical protein n=1 Tax=Citrobacter freundii TaxID=546 RepID=UPI0039787B84
MTTTQNVTELQPRMTREQLIDAARKAAPLLPVAYRGIMTELANRLDIVSVALCESMEQRKALAIENTVLRDDVNCWAKECDRIVERHTKSPTNMHMLEAQRELCELTPVTDQVIRDIQATGVEKYANITIAIGKEEQEESIVCAGNQALLFANQLREGTA